MAWERLQQPVHQTSLKLGANHWQMLTDVQHQTGERPTDIIRRLIETHLSDTSREQEKRMT